MDGPLSQSNAGKIDTSRFDASQDALTKAYENLTSALGARNEGDKTRELLLAISQGMLTPGPTGSFGESLGQAAGNVMKVQRSQEADALENAKMRLEMAKAGRGIAQEQAVSQAIPQIYRQTEAGMEVNPEALQTLARVTGDPKYVEMLYQHDKTKRLREAGQNVFTQIVTKGENGEEKTSYQFNPNSVFALAKASDNPMETIAKYADMVPKLRKAGMLKDLSGDISTPFDAIALMAANLGSAGPAYAEQARRLAKQYQTGMIDDDKANTLATQMMQTLVASMDRQSQLQNTKVMQEFQRMMSLQNFEMNQQKLEDKRKEQEGKLTDEQKETYKKIIIPIVNEGVKGNTALMQVERLSNVIQNAPSGTLQGLYASSIGRLFGTDDNTALRELQGLSKGLIPMIPRLPGSASNLDSNNLEKSVMQLSDPTLTNKQRADLIVQIKDGFKALTDRAESVQTHWDSYKKFDPKILNPEPAKPAAPKSGTPAASVTPPASAAPVLRWNPATKQFEQ
jgi:hypothetical protein